MKPLARFSLTAMIVACSTFVAEGASETHEQTGQQDSSESQSLAEFQAFYDLAKQYEQTYNASDAKKLASFFAEDVDYIDENGDETRGRDQIEKLLTAAFEANKGAKLEVAVEGVRQLSPTVVVEKGTATITKAEGAAHSTRYVAVHVKKGDNWEISELTETPAPPQTASDALQALDWLVGTWQDKSGDQTVDLTVDWSGDKNFLTRKFKITGGEQSETEGWEIIGWDPEQRHIRSWIFDSNGGFGEATWVQDGDQWLIQASNVLPDGSRSTVEHVLTQVDDNKYTWESQNRTLNGEPQPSLRKVEVTRVATQQ